VKFTKFNRSVLTSVLVLFLVSGILAQNPQKSWQQYKTPEEAGFSSAAIKEARAIYDQMDAAAFMVVFKGYVLISWGDVERRFMCHSVRKSLLSGLYGIYVDEGIIDLDKTMEELNIDDKSPLTKEEKQATIKDLLKARSGIYHPAAYETLAMKAKRPRRGSRKHNSYWYYNNWDFNVLCTIFKQVTKTDFFVAFKKRLADPLQMEDFRVMDGYYHLEPENSIHPAYPFKLSARDMARFGLLFLREGKWNNKQIISQQWIKESITPYSRARGNSHYGYLWWILDNFQDKGGLYTALGVGSQVIAVLPGLDMVVVQRVDTYQGKRAAINLGLINKIIDAKEFDAKPNPKFIPLQNTPSFKRQPIIKLKSKVLKQYAGEYPFGGFSVTVEYKDGSLVAYSPVSGHYRLLPVSKTQFIVEDSENVALFQLDKNGMPVNLTFQQTVEAANFYLDVLKRGAAVAIKSYQQKKKTGKIKKSFSEGDINNMGYQLLNQNKMKDAIELFKLNVQLNPKAFNAYDSLAEAYMKNGDYKLAEENYKKSLELNSRNSNARTMLRRLEEKKRSNE
jgi:CubicO group peptidase (beta-lactamase class C family)